MKPNFLIFGTGIATLLMSFTLTNPKPTTTPAITFNVPNGVLTIQKQHPGEILINKSDCIGCHKKDSQLIGPSYKDIAKKYTNNEKNINLLAGKIINGGSGVWSEIPMTPHPKISTNDAKTMVKYILTLKK